MTWMTESQYQHQRLQEKADRNNIKVMLMNSDRSHLEVPSILGEIRLHLSLGESALFYGSKFETFDIDEVLLSFEDENYQKGACVCV